MLIIATMHSPIQGPKLVCTTLYFLCFQFANPSFWIVGEEIIDGVFCGLDAGNTGSYAVCER